MVNLSFGSRLFGCLLFFLLFSFISVEAKDGRAVRWGFRPRYGPVQDYYQINLTGGVRGPESLAFDCKGDGPYVGVSDGRVLRWQGPDHGWVEFAVTTPNRSRELCDGSSDTSKEPICGRPLGLRFHPKTCELYIADAYFGLLKVGADGGVATQLVASAEGVTLKFTNDLDIDPNTGVVYFTDSSIYHQRRFFTEAIANGDATGRLLRYDPSTNSVKVLDQNLAFANGVTLSEDNSYLLLIESTRYRILKYPVTSSGVGSPIVFANVYRFADNIRKNSNGEYWVAFNTARNIEAGELDIVGVKYNAYGRVVRMVDGNGGNTLSSVSDIEEHNGRLWFGSPVQSYVATLTLV